MSIAGREHVLSITEGHGDLNGVLDHEIFSGETVPLDLGVIRPHDRVGQTRLYETLDPCLEALFSLEKFLAGGTCGRTDKTWTFTSKSIADNLARGATTGTMKDITAELIDPEELTGDTRLAAFPEISTAPSIDRTRLAVVIGGLYKVQRSKMVGCVLGTQLRVSGEGHTGRQATGRARWLRDSEVTKLVTSRRGNETPDDQPS